jgi:hypothetical protein
LRRLNLLAADVGRGSGIAISAPLVFAFRDQTFSSTLVLERIMPNRRTFLFAAACSFVMPRGIVTASAVAGDAAATSFVTKIYDAYKGKNTKGIALNNDAQIRRYFEPPLAALIIKDENSAARRHEVGTLDGDPFVDAQDWEISTFDIAVNDVAPGKAVATVNFKNDDRPVKLVLNLVKVKNDWRIADIIADRDGQPESLRGLFKH